MNRKLSRYVSITNKKPRLQHLKNGKLFTEELSLFITIK